MEIWKKIEDYEGLYEVSNLGRVRNSKGKIKSLYKNLQITKYKDYPNIKLPSNVREYFKDNTVLNTLIAKGKVSV